MFRKQISANWLLVIVSFFITIFGSWSYWSKVLGVFELNTSNAGFLISLLLFTCGLTVILLSLFSFKYLLKPVVVLVLLSSAFAAYFMDSYNVIIDSEMINNTFKTDPAEVYDLLNLKLAIYVILLGIVPALLVVRTKISYLSFVRETFSRIVLIVGCLAVMVGSVFAFGNFYAPFFREHKPLRYYANPGYYIYSVGKYASSNFSTSVKALKEIGTDAAIPPTDVHRELIVFVVGESARADRFSINGYARETNPLLNKENVISFSNFWACGTSTAYSLPCMFSNFEENDYTKKKALGEQNVLDIITNAGVNVLWLDNNSDSKGVATRVAYQSYKSPTVNPVCDDECRDVGMLENLQQYIDAHPVGDIFIVLHQMGNHGPAYYKRYPREFERFTPVCKTSDIQQCTTKGINNGYDNAILYTDYFLSEVISLLKKQQNKFEAAMFYVSDHGESLGENGLYLHGMPRVLAPDEQTHIPAIMWFGESFEKDEINYQKLVDSRNDKFSHDNLFHTILGLMEIESEVYVKAEDMIDHDG